MVDAEGENSIVVASGANLDVRAHQVSDALLKSNRVLILQQEVSFEENESLGCRAQQAGLQIVLNLAPATQIPTGLLANTNFLIVNEVEAAFLAGEQTQVSMTDLAEHLADTYDCGTLITLGPAGCVVASGDERAFGVDAPGVEVVDTTGAGDTFTGYFAALLAQEHLSLRQCVAGATQAASLACTRMGAQSGIPCAEDVLRAKG
jgi:ribokinase